MNSVNQAKFASVLGVFGMICAMLLGHDVGFLASTMMACTFCAALIVMEANDGK